MTGRTSIALCSYLRWVGDRSEAQMTDIIQMARRRASALVNTVWMIRQKKRLTVKNFNAILLPNLFLKKSFAIPNQPSKSAVATETMRAFDIL